MLKKRTSKSSTFVPRPPKRASSVKKLKKLLRKAIRVTLFCVFVKKLANDAKWGTYVETVDNPLLESKKRFIPESYFKTMGKCSLPPGWVTCGLPIEVQQQIRTFAKNKIVRLVTPIARLRAHRHRTAAFLAQRMSLRSEVTTTMLRKHSTFFEILPESILEELLRTAEMRAYLTGMWVIPPSSSTEVNGLMLLQGTIAEVMTAPEGGIASTEGEYSAVSIMCETRYIFATPSLFGFLSKSPCVILEFGWKSIRQSCLASMALGGPARRFITSNRCQQMQRIFPLTLSLLRELHFFHFWEEGELAHLLTLAKPKVAFPREVIVEEGEMTNEIIIACRGDLVVCTNGHQRAVLNEGECFGESTLVFEEKSLAALVAGDEIADFWTFTRYAIFSHLKATALRKMATQAAVHIRELFLESTVERSVLLQRLADVLRLNVQEDAACLESLAPLLHARVLGTGERFATAGDEVTGLYLFDPSCGKISESTKEGYNTFPPPPCLPQQGLNCLGKERWPTSLMAVRNTECWFLEKKEALKVLRIFPNILARLQKKQHLPTGVQPMLHSAVKPFSEPQSARPKRIQMQFNVPQLVSQKRGEFRRKQIEQRHHQEQEAEKAKEHRAALRMAALAPPLHSHVSMLEYEGIHKVVAAPKEVYASLRDEKAHKFTSNATAQLDQVTIRESGKGVEIASAFSVSDAALLESETRKNVQQMFQNEVRRQENAMAEAAIPRTSMARRFSLKTRFTVSSDSERSFEMSMLRESGIGGGGRDKKPMSVSRNVLKELMRKHNNKIAEQRNQCANEADVSRVINSNPFSSFRRRRQGLQKITPLGELYMQHPGGAIEKFDAAKYNTVIPTSFISAHGFSEIETLE